MAVPQHAASNRRFVDDLDTDRLDTRAPLATMPNGSFESSNVHSAIFDYGASELFVRYLRDAPDAIYQYWDVPPSNVGRARDRAVEGIVHQREYRV